MPSWLRVLGVNGEVVMEEGDLLRLTRAAAVSALADKTCTAVNLRSNLAVTVPSHMVYVLTTLQRPSETLLVSGACLPHFLSIHL